MRDEILARVRANRPPARPHPGAPPPSAAPADPLAAFAAASALSRATTIRYDPGDGLSALLRQLHPDAAPRYVHPELVADYGAELADGAVALRADATPHELAAVQLAVLPARLGVLENGACWLDETCWPHRALPFATEHLALVLPREALVPTMHEAYARCAAGPGFGVFIAGPSKTADIEQSLVVGAQGPRSLAVVLV